MEISGDLLLIIGSVFVLLCGPRWSRRSLDTSAVLLTISRSRNQADKQTDEQTHAQTDRRTDGLILPGLKILPAKA